VTIHDLRIQYTQGSSFAADKRLKENCLSCQTCNLKISPVCKHIQSSRSFFSSWRNYRPGLFGMTRFNSFDDELRAINQESRWIAQGGCCTSILHIQITMLHLVSISGGVSEHYCPMIRLKDDTQGSSFPADNVSKENCLSCQPCGLKISPVCKCIKQFFSSEWN
jgi:hypothetical protein